MTRRQANYEVVRNEYETGGPLTIRDVGPWDRHPTITNAAEDVVDGLLLCKELGPNQRLMYYDSDGNLDEITHDGIRFTGFRAGRR